MRTTFMRAATADGLLLQGQLYEPDGPCHAAVLHVHGMAGNFYENAFLDVFARIFTDAGVAVLAANTRGHDMVADFALVGGGSRRVGSAYERFAESRLDIDAWVARLDGFERVVLQGHSLGASKVVAYLDGRKSDVPVLGAVLLSPTEMIQFAEAQPDHVERYAEAQALAAAGRGMDLLPGFVWDYQLLLSAGTYLDLTTRGNPVDVFTGYDSEAPAALGAVTMPLLAVYGTRDEGLVCSGRTAEEHLALLKAKATSCPTFTSCVVEDDHGYATQASEVAGIVAAWVRRL